MPEQTFFLSLATELVRQDVDWADKYKGKCPQCRQQSGTDVSADLSGSDVDKQNNVMDLLVPSSIPMSDSKRKSMEQFLRVVNGEQCIPTAMGAIPFPLNKRAKCCQVCHYELKNPKTDKVHLGKD